MYRDSKGRFTSALKGDPPKHYTPYRDSHGRFASNPNKPAPTFKATNDGRINLTVADVINAIEKNGYKQITGSWHRRDSGGHIVAGCAIGQGAANLGVRAETLHNKLNHIYGTGGALGSHIIGLNDAHGLSIPQIVARIRAEYKNQLNVSLGIRGKAL